MCAIPSDSTSVLQLVFMMQLGFALVSTLIDREPCWCCRPLAVSSVLLFLPSLHLLALSQSSRVRMLELLTDHLTCSLPLGALGPRAQRVLA